MNLGAVFARNLGHRSADLAEAALYVINAVGMLGVRNHGEQARTIPRRHAEVLRLKRKCEAQFLGSEIGCENVVERAAGGDVRSAASSVGLNMSRALS